MATIEELPDDFPAGQDASTAETSVTKEVDTATKAASADVEAEKENKPAGGSKGAPAAEDPLKKNLMDQIARLEEKKSEDKDEEKVLARMHKKATKDVKEQLDAVEGPNEKIKFLQQKYLDKVHEANKLDKQNGTLQRSLDTSNREKDSLTQELARVNTIKKKLETLCKELTKQNKSVLDQSKQVSSEESLRRQEIHQKFSDSIKDVQEKMDAQDKERMKQAEENEKLREQLQSFLNQYEVREKHFEQQLKQKDLEVQLESAKLRQAEELLKQSQSEVQQFRAIAETLSQRDTESRAQLAMYAEKFEGLQGTIAKSNDQFISFKKDSEKLAKRCKALEKEKREAVQNSDKNNASVKELSQSCDQLRKDLVVVTKQKSSMEMLCRKLTEERAALKEKLKAYEPEPETKPEAAKEETAEADATNKQADASEPAAAAEEAAAEPVAAGQ